MPLSAFAQGSPFDNGFTALQTLFTGTIAKVARLIAIELDTPKPCEDVGRKHSDPGAGGRVFKSLHKPLTYLGVERTVFYFVCVGAAVDSWHTLARHSLLLCCFGSGLEFLQMNLCQIWLIQLPIEIC
jgi:hypothetical protein